MSGLFVTHKTATDKAPTTQMKISKATVNIDDDGGLHVTAIGARGKLTSGLASLLANLTPPPALCRPSDRQSLRGFTLVQTSMQCVGFTFTAEAITERRAEGIEVRWRKDQLAEAYSVEARHLSHLSWAYKTDSIVFYPASLSTYPSFVDDSVKLHGIIDILPRSRESRIYSVSKVTLPVKSALDSYVLTATRIILTQTPYPILPKGGEVLWVAKR